MSSKSCCLKKEILFNNLFKEENINPDKNFSCSLGISSNHQLFALKKLGAYVDDYDSVKVYNHNFQIIASFFCGNGSERGIVFWPDDEHILTAGFAQNSVKEEQNLSDGLKLYSIYEPQKYTNPLIDIPVDILREINCEIYASSPSGRYVCVSNHEQIMIDTEKNKWWKIKLLSEINEFSFDETYLISSMNLRLGGNYGIYDISQRKCIFEGSGFLGTNPLRNTYYYRGYNFKSSISTIVEKSFDGEIVRESPFKTFFACSGVSQDNQWMALGDEHGGLKIISLEDVSEIYEYHEVNNSSAFTDEYPSKIVFLDNPRSVLVHYWQVGVRVFTF